MDEYLKPIMCDRFDINKLRLGTIERSNHRVFDRPSPTRYEYEQGLEFLPILQTGYIRLDQRGMPRIGGYTNSKEKISFIKIPLDPNQKACEELERVLRQMDEYASEHEFFDRYLKKIKKIFDFSHIVRRENYIPEPDEPFGFSDIVRRENYESPISYEPFDEKKLFDFYCKFRLYLDYENNTIKTHVFVKQNGISSEIKVKSLEEMHQFFEKSCMIRFLFTPVPSASKEKDSEGKRRYGLSLLVSSMEIIPGETDVDLDEYGYNDYYFYDPDDEIDFRDSFKDYFDADGAMFPDLNFLDDEVVYYDDVEYTFTKDGHFIVSI